MSEIAERLDAIQTRLDAATPGPWVHGGMDSMHSKYEVARWVTTADVGDTICDMDGLARSQNERHAKDDGGADAEFIAAAPSDVAFLLNLARKQQAQLDAVRELAATWHMRGENDIAYSKVIPDEDVSMALLTNGSDMVENARHIRKALDDRT